MTVTQASLDALAAHTRKRGDTVRTRIEKALRELRKQNADITISSVSRRAGVTRKSIYRREDLVALIRAHRPVTTLPDDKTTHARYRDQYRGRVTGPADRQRHPDRPTQSNLARTRPHYRRPARRPRTNRRAR